MKLNSPWKALLWEEMCVAGSIVTLITFNIFLLIPFGILPFFFVYGYRSLPLFSFAGYDAVSFVISAITSFLIILHIGNSGQLQSGFPRRILNLPVPTYLPVAISFFTRLFLILVQAVLIRIALLAFLENDPYKLPLFMESPAIFFREFFKLFEANGETFGMAFCFHAIVYIAIQTLMWLINFSIPFTISIFIVIWGIISWVNLLDFFGYEFIFNSVFNILKNFFIYHPILFLCVVAIIFYGINLQIIKGIRRNSQYNYDFTRLIPKFLRVFFFRGNLPLLVKRFPNRYTARIWFEISLGYGFILPAWTFILWLFMTVLLYAARFISGLDEIFKYSRYIPYISDEAFFILRLLTPHFCLIFAGVLWYLLVTRRIQKEIKQKSGQLWWMPITKIELINTSTFNFSINLISAMLVVWIIEFYIVYTGRYLFLPPIPETIQSVLTTNADAFRSFYPSYFWGLVACITGHIIITGSIVWIFVSYPIIITLLIALIFLLVMLSFSIAYIWKAFIWELFAVPWKSIPILRTIIVKIDYLIADIARDFYCYLIGDINGSPEILFFYFFICYFLIAMFLVYLSLAFYNRILKFRHFVILLAIYIFVFICIFPYQYVSDFPLPFMAITYFAITSIVMMPWIRSTMKSHGIRLLKPIRITTPVYSSEVKIYSIILSHIFIILIPCLVIGIRFHSSQNYERMIAFFKERHLPSNYEEINDWYKPVPPDKNLARKYWLIQDIPNTLNYIFYIYSDILSGKSQAIEQVKDESLREDLRKHIQFVESLNLTEECKDAITKYINSGSMFEDDKPFAELVFIILKDFYNTAGTYVTVPLKEIADLNLTETRYPLNLQLGLETPLPHLAPLRALVRILSGEAIIYAVDDKYDEMLRSFKACIPIYKSLKNEPFGISQLVRIAIFGIVRENIKWVINHKELPEPVLLELNDIVQNFSPKNDEEPLLRKDIYIDSFYLLDIFSNSSKFRIMAEDYYLYNNSFTYLVINLLSKEKYFNPIWLPTTDLILPYSVWQTTIFLHYLVISEYYEQVIQAKNINIPQKDKFNQYLKSDLYWDIKNRWNSNIFSFLDSSIKWVHAELRHHAYIGLMNTVLAIEQFRLAYNRLPENLQELVPDYLPSVPKDPWTPGNDIRFVKGEDESYKVYCVGMDEEDDGGKDNGKPDGDYLIEIASKSKRMQPAISKEVLPECMQKNTERTAKQ
ncbi:MAG TPA: hypothetical protein PLX23_04835 [Candidatus Hydrogenedens sp.]|nr:hypothetical protein [Candidatus Hydrogenedens sp.]